MDESVPAHLAIFPQKRRQPLRSGNGLEVHPFHLQPVDGSFLGGAVHPDVGDGVDPGLHLPVQVRVIHEARRGPEVAPEVLDPALHPPLGLSPVRPAEPDVEPHPQGEVQEAFVPHRQPALVPAQDHHLGVVVQTVAWDAAQPGEGVDVAADEGVNIRPADELHIDRPRPTQHHHEGPDPARRALRRPVSEQAEVHLDLLAGPGLETDRRR